VVVVAEPHQSRCLAQSPNEPATPSLNDIMAGIPDEALVSGFVEFTGADTITAMQFLRVCAGLLMVVFHLLTSVSQGANNHLETAVGHYFDNPDRHLQVGSLPPVHLRLLFA
jgi:hypothetical protein